MRIYLVVIILTCIFRSSAENNLTIRGDFHGFADSTSVALSQFTYEDIIVSKAIIKSGKCQFTSLPQLQDGIYQIIVNHPAGNKNKQSTYFFNIIIDKSERDIEFSFNPSVSQLPNFTKSEINKNWYLFLKFQNFRLDALAHIINVKNGKETTKLDLKNKVDDIFKTELAELIQIRSNFLEANFNKWSNYMVKNTPIYSNLLGISKENYWSQYETNNHELINTPIYQELIRNYLITYYNHSDEEQYKIVFQEVIDIFSNNESTKEWIIKYIITGLYRIENDKLSSYFSKKYNYKI